jgi:hypothetical protein
MTQTKTRASRFGGRLFKSAATSALALSALAGGVMLSGGEGKAQSFCTPPGDADGNMIPGPADCTVEDPNLGFPPTVQLTRASILPGPPSNPFPPLPPGTNVSYELTGLNYPFAQTQIDTDFNVPGTGNYTGGLLVGPTYTVQALNHKIDGIDLAAAGIGAFTVQKDVWLSDPSLPGSSIYTTLNLTGAGFVPVVDLPILAKSGFATPTTTLLQAKARLTTSKTQFAHQARWPSWAPAPASASAASCGVASRRHAPLDRWVV